MEKDILHSNTNPFTVPDGYFDTLQERIMKRIQTEESKAKDQGRTIRMHSYRRTLIAAAACILLIFTGAALYITYTGKQNIVAQMAIDDDFYHWFYAADGETLLAESLDIHVPENFMADETAYSEEDEAIIRFLERENINVVAIVHSINHNELSYIP
jgi:hypothetical protein